jgi:ribosomal protein S3AE
MFDIINREVTTSDLKEVVSKLIPDSMSLDIQVIHFNITLNERSKYY